MNEYFYIFEENEAILAESVCVAGVNVAGTGEFSEPLALSRACKYNGVVAHFEKSC